MLNLFERGLDSESCCPLRITQSDSLIKRFFRVLLLLPSFLCLDAAFVALGWSQYLAHERAGTILSLPENFPASEVTVRELALFLCVWVIYLFDRLYDSRRIPDSETTPLRHQFAKRHFHFLAGLLVVGVVFLVFLVPRLEISDWILGLSVGTGVAVYFFLFRFAKNFSPIRKLVSRFPIKETALAIFFTLGVMGAAERFSDSSTSLAENLLLGATFTSLVLANCLFIAFAERDFDHSFDPSSYFSHSHPSGTKVLLGVSTFTLFLALCLEFASRSSSPAILIGCSAAGLGLTHLSRMPLRFRQATLDAILLMPWIPILLEFSTNG